MTASAESPGRSEVPDALVALWCALWLVVGGWTAYEVWQLASLSETVAVSGRSLDEAGSALESLEPVPVVGESAAELGTRVRANAAEIVRDAGDARQSVRRLSVLLGLAIGLVPTVPVLVAHRTLRGGARRARAT